MSDAKNSKFSWFKLEDYAPTKEFGFADWATMLQIRWNYEQQWPPKIDHLAPEAIKELRLAPEAITELRQRGATTAAWNNYLRVALPREYIENGRKTLHGRTLPAVEDITNLIKHGNTSGLKPEANWFGTRIVRINTSTPDDALLIEGFRQFLIQVHKFDPLPVARSGPHGLNTKITNKHLESWAEYRVLAVIDLDFCSEVFGSPTLSHKELCDLLVPHKPVGPTDWGQEARRKAEEAKESLDLLIAQACSEQAPPDKNRAGTN